MEHVNLSRDDKTGKMGVVFVTKEVVAKEHVHVLKTKTPVEQTEK